MKRRIRTCSSRFLPHCRESCRWLFTYSWFRIRDELETGIESPKTTIIGSFRISGRGLEAVISVNWGHESNLDPWTRHSNRISGNNQRQLSNLRSNSGDSYRISVLRRYVGVVFVVAPYSTEGGRRLPETVESHRITSVLFGEHSQTGDPHPALLSLIDVLRKP